MSANGSAICITCVSRRPSSPCDRFFATVTGRPRPGLGDRSPFSCDRAWAPRCGEDWGAGSAGFSSEIRLLRRAGFSATSRSGVVGSRLRVFFCTVFTTGSSATGSGWAGASFSGSTTGTFSGAGASSTLLFCTASLLVVFFLLLLFRANWKSSAWSVYSCRFFLPAAFLGSPSCCFVFIVVVVLLPLTFAFFAGGSFSLPLPSPDSRALRLLPVAPPFIPMISSGNRVRTMDMSRFLSVRFCRGRVNGEVACAEAYRRRSRRGAFIRRSRYVARRSPARRVCREWA